MGSIMESQKCKIGDRVCLLNTSKTGIWLNAIGTVVSVATPSNPDPTEIGVEFDNGYRDTAPSSEFIRVTDYGVVSIDDIKFVRELQSPISIIVGVVIFRGLKCFSPILDNESPFQSIALLVPPNTL